MNICAENILLSNITDCAGNCKDMNIIFTTTLWCNNNKVDVEVRPICCQSSLRNVNIATNVSGYTLLRFD